MKRLITRCRLMRRLAVQMIIGMTVACFAVGASTVLPALAQGRLRITIGYVETPDWLLYVARDLKLFEKAGLAPTYVKFAAGPPMIAATQNGSLDLASVGSEAFLMGLSQGVDWVMIGINPEGSYSEGLVAQKDGGINIPTDLRGKRIGLFKGSTAQFGLMMMLRQFGIHPDQVTLLHMSPEEQLLALKSRKIDAAMVWEPWLQRMIHETNARVIGREGDLGIYTNVDCYAVRRQWLRDNRETALRFVRGLLMANDVVEKDPRIAIRIWAREMGIKEAWAKKIYEDVPPPLINQWTNPRYTYSLVNGSPLQRSLGFLAMFLLNEKLISQPVDLDDVMDASVVAEALRTRKSGR
jgi:ABC-type nitrate/sulfonate/bicarbonate transport system substrate-binding protein